MRPNKALQLTRRRRSACQALQPAGGRSGGRFAGRPPDVSSRFTGGAQLSAVSVRPRSAPRYPPLASKSLLASQTGPSSGPSSSILLPLISGDPSLSVWSSARGISYADAGWGSPIHRSPAFVSVILVLRGSRRLTPRWTFSAEPFPPRPLPWGSRRRRSCWFGRGSGRASRDQRPPRGLVPSRARGPRWRVGSRAAAAA